MDASGLSDPYARVVCGNQSACSRIIRETLSPTWDQTLIIDKIQIYGDIEEVLYEPPSVVIELFDYDPVVSCFVK